jgi:hypothetical protein
MHTLNAQRMPASMMKKVVVTALVAATVVATAGTARAESFFVTGAGALSAPTHLDFTIIVPKILFLQVGTGPVAPALTANGAINLLTFTVPAANVGDSTVISSTGGDLSSGAAVTARVVANSGTVTVTTTTPNMLKDAGTDTISYSQIGLVVATLTSGTAFTPAALSDGAVTTTTIAPTSNVVNQDAKWTFTYKNQNVVAAGTYGTSANQGRVLYTASIL